MIVQYVIVVLIIAAALALAGRALYLKTRSFSKKSGCDADCGCCGKSKKLSSKPV